MSTPERAASSFFRGADDDTRTVDLLHDAGALGDDDSARVTGDDGFHAGADQRGVRLHQRHGLTLHVRAHEGAVGVIVFEERDQGGGDRHDLARRHVHQVDRLLLQEGRFAVDAARDQVVDDLAFQHRDVGLGDDVLGFLHRRHVDDFVLRLAVLHATVRALDEAVLVDARVGRQAVDQTDVRAFRRFDRADPAVVGRVNVADFEAGALAGQTARAEGRETTLVGDFRQRVRLVHELRQLRGAEEFTHGGRGRLGVDQVVRHDRVDIDRAHAFLDRAFHAQQADAVLVFQQLAHRADATVAQVVDVVDFAATVAQAHQDLQHGQDVVLAQDADLVRDFLLETHVHLHAAHRRQVVALGVEEQRLEHRLGRFHGRRLARTHDAVDVEQRVLADGVLVHAQGVAHVGADRDVVDVQHVDGAEALVGQGLDRRNVQLVAGFRIDLAGLEVDGVAGQVAAGQGLGRQQQGLQTRVGELLGLASRDLGAGRRDLFAGVGVNQRELRLHAAPALGLVRGGPAALRFSNGTTS
jgi:hypothetical protein